MKAQWQRRRQQLQRACMCACVSLLVSSLASRVAAAGWAELDTTDNKSDTIASAVRVWGGEFDKGRESSEPRERTLRLTFRFYRPFAGSGSASRPSLPSSSMMNRRRRRSLFGSYSCRSTARRRAGRECVLALVYDFRKRRRL
jgi:hypothetical protein